MSEPTPKLVSYDFELTSGVGVEAPEGTDPETLVDQALRVFAERCRTGEAEVQLFQVFDPETGKYTHIDGDWRK